jgi:hypothetical protein
MNDRIYHLTVRALTDKGVQCSIGDGEAFWLPRNGHVKWQEEPAAGKQMSALIPGWLVPKHRQLADEGMTVEEWRAIRKKEALNIDPHTAEVLVVSGLGSDPYGIFPPLPEGDYIGRNRFARRPGSSVWVWFGDLPKEVRDAIDDKHNSVEEWRAIRKEEALKIDPKTAQVKSCDALTLDPVDHDLPAESRQAGREYFTRRPGSSVWVWFGDLPEEVRDALSPLAKYAHNFAGLRL